MRFAFLVSFGVIAQSLILGATTFTFNTDTRTVTSDDTSGTLTAVRGAPFTTALAADGVAEFRFGSSLSFFFSDEVYVVGTRAARWVVSGDVFAQGGSTIRVRAGGGTGASAAPGGDGGLPVPLAVALGEIDPDQVLAFGIPNRGGEGGAGATSSTGAETGEPGDPGVVANPPGGGVSLGHIGGPGKSGTRRLGGQGFNNSVENDDGESYYFDINGSGVDLNADPETPGGSGGNPGTTGGFLGDGTPGDPGDPGTQGEGGLPGGDGRFGFRGKYANDATSPVLVGGGGGGSGLSGGGGGAGFSGGAGGGGGGGGRGGTSISGNSGNGGAGGKGGAGHYGGIGGDGGNGGAGGNGGGALEIRAIGFSINIQGTIDASGQDGLAGSPGQAGSIGNLALIPVGIDITEGSDGLAGQVVTGTDGGRGGRGGDGGLGGTGGDGGDGGPGGGGAGGTVILRASTVSTFLDSVDVSGGHSSNENSIGQPGQFFSFPTPNLELSTTSINLATTTGQNATTQSFTLSNNGGLGSDFQYETLITADANGPWWLSVDQPEGFLVGGGSKSLQLSFDTASLGGGTYTANITFRDKNSNSAALPVTLQVTLTLSGPADDHFDRIAAATDLGAIGETMILTGNIESGGDYDVFEFNFTTAEDVHFEVFTTGTLDTVGEFVIPGPTEGSEVKVLENDDSVSGGDLNFYLTATVNASFLAPHPYPYFLRVRAFGPGQTGDYQLHIRRVPDSNVGGFSQEVVNSFNGQALAFGSLADQPYRVYDSTDLEAWRILEDGLRAGKEEGKHTVPLRPAGEVSPPRRFFTTTNLHPVVPFRYLSPSSASPTQPVAFSNVAGGLTNFRIGLLDSGVGETEPIQEGVTPRQFPEDPPGSVELNLRFSQFSNVALASARKESFPIHVSVVGNVTTPFPGDDFIPGTRFHSRAAVGGVVFNAKVHAAIFPLPGGWRGGYVTNHIFSEIFQGELPTGSSIQREGTTNTHLLSTVDGFSSANGVFLANPASRLISETVTMAPVYSGGIESGVRFTVHNEQGDALPDAQFGFIHLPFSTAHAVVGRVNADGSQAVSSPDYTSTWNAAESGYHLQFANAPDFTQGTLLLNSRDPSNEGHFTWSILSAGGVLVQSYNFPINGRTFQQCGFEFAWIPFDPIIRHPDAPNL